MAYNPNMYLPQYGAYTHPTWYTPPSTQPINGLVSVTGIEGAKAYQLPPNSAMPLFDGNQDILYLKTTDSAGYPTIKTFSFKAMEEPKHAPQEQGGEYVQRSEFDALVEQVTSLVGQAAKKGKGDGK